MSDHARTDALFASMYDDKIKHGSPEFEAARKKWRAELVRAGELGTCRDCGADTTGGDLCRAHKGAP